MTDHGPWDPYTMLPEPLRSKAIAARAERLDILRPHTSDPEVPPLPLLGALESDSDVRERHGIVPEVPPKVDNPSVHRITWPVDGDAYVEHSHGDDWVSADDVTQCGFKEYIERDWTVRPMAVGFPDQDLVADFRRIDSEPDENGAVQIEWAGSIYPVRR